MHIGPSLDFIAAMNLEFRIVSRIIGGHDFYEGVRAVIIDKDQKPVWSPARIEGVKSQEIAAYFAPLSGGELREH
jgi:enoyl-CoA hydratase